MGEKFRRSRHSVTEWASLARCERLYAWDALGRAPVDAHIESLLKGSEENSEASKLGTKIHAALSTERFSEVRDLGFPHLAEWAHERLERDPADFAWDELNFELRLEPSPGNSEILVGAMDRVERRGDAYLLIDYKILQSQKSDAALLDSYRLPMSLYAYALGQLAPDARDRLRAVLVCATANSLREIEVPLPSYAALEAEVLRHCQKAVAVVNRADEARPEPSEACRSCRYRPHCVEGRAPLH